MILVIIRMKPTKFTEKPSASLCCPVCKRVFGDPVISVKCGHTFCKQCIIQLAEENGKCPLDNVLCEGSNLVPNRALMAQIDDLSIHCCHGIKSSDHGSTWEVDSEGCPEIIKYGKREEHESSCLFELVQCSYGGELCEKVRKSELEQHYKNCTSIPCPFSEFGCAFRGSQSAVEDHKGSCSCSSELHIQTVTMAELKQLKSAHTDLEQQLSAVQKQYQLLHKDNEKLLSIVNEQANLIVNLTSRLEVIEVELKQSRRMSSVTRTTGDNGKPEVTPRHHRRWTASSDQRRWSSESVISLPDSQRGTFTWQMPFTLKCIGTFRGHNGTVWSMVASADRMYSSCSDGSIKMWDVADMRRGCMKTIVAHSDYVMCVAVGRELLFSGGSDRCLRSWQADTLDKVGEVKFAHDDIISAMAYTGTYLFTSSYAMIKVWDALTLKELHKNTGLNHWVRALVYDKRRDVVYSGSHNKVHVWRASDDFTVIKEIQTQYGTIYAMAVTKAYLIVGTFNQNIQIMDVQSHNHIRTLTGHIGTVTCLCTTPCGQFMFSASVDTTVQVWSLEKMLPIQTLQRHEKAIYALALWHDTLYSGSEDMEIKLYKHFRL